MNKILKKSYKILGISFAILILALIFFFWRGRELYQAMKSGGQFKLTPLSPGFTNDTGLSGNSFDASNLPSPNKFSSFSYPQKKYLEIKTKCADKYYAVLIFGSGVDYRQDPRLAKLNRAYPCQIGEKVERQIDLTELNLSQGKYYYFVADQGEGTWYNPR